MQKIKNIIFDLGGVILNLDFMKTELAFAGYGIGNFNQYYTLQTATPVFEQLETGKISPEVFYDVFRKITMTSITNEQIEHAWNALLLDFPPARIQYLKELRNRYQIFLLSNTNEIHYRQILKIYTEQNGGEDFNNIFMKAYYSHQLGMRKPDTLIFETVLKDAGLDAQETLFIDDAAANIESAKNTGLQTIHLSSPKTILELGL
jgi:putative hydrolase of the HAD superfamily